MHIPCIKNEKAVFIFKMIILYYMLNDIQTFQKKEHLGNSSILHIHILVKVSSNIVCTYKQSIHDYGNNYTIYALITPHLEIVLYLHKIFK